MKSKMWEKNEMRETMKLKHLDLFSTYLKEDITRSIKCPIAQWAFSSYSGELVITMVAVCFVNLLGIFTKDFLPCGAGEGAK